MGVFPADRIPMRWPKPYALIIINTDNHDKPGVHWVAIYLNQEGKAVYFDSYGIPVMIHHHHQRLRKNAKQFIWNTKRLQSFNSTVCGHYCVMFLYYMSHGYTLENFCNIFSDNYKCNDGIVKKFLNKITRKKMRHYKKLNKYILKGNGRNRLCIHSCKPKFYVFS